MTAVTAACAGPNTPWDPLIDCLPQATWVVELASLAIVAVNRAALVLLALPQQAVIGQRADHLLATPEDLAYWDEVRAGPAGRLRSDTTVCTADGRTVFVERCIEPMVADAAAAAALRPATAWFR